MNADPVKYEVDKETGAIFVDRFMLTAMHYPCNYGYIPQTLSEDGDPADVLVVTPFPIQIGAVVLPRHRRAGNGRRVGRRRQAAGRADRKALPPYRNIKSYEDLPTEDISRIQHFFEHYKDLERASGSRSRAGRAWRPLTRKSSRAPNATTRPDQGLVRAGVAPVRVPCGAAATA